MLAYWLDDWNGLEKIISYGNLRETQEELASLCICLVLKYKTFGDVGCLSCTLPVAWEEWELIYSDYEVDMRREVEI